MGLPFSFLFVKEPSYRVAVSLAVIGIHPLPNDRFAHIGQSTSLKSIGRNPGFASVRNPDEERVMRDVMVIDMKKNGGSSRTKVSLNLIDPGARKGFILKATIGRAFIKASFEILGPCT
jgi:hypothetical protein